MAVLIKPSTRRDLDQNGVICGVDIGLRWKLGTMTVQVDISGCVVLIGKWLWVVWGCGGGLVMRG